MVIRRIITQYTELLGFINDYRNLSDFVADSCLFGSCRFTYTANINNENYIISSVC